jgi:hypothetical protein
MDALKLYDLHCRVKRLCATDGVNKEYLHIEKTPLKVGRTIVEVEYITPSWFTDAVFINYQNERISTSDMRDEEFDAFVKILDEKFGKE